MDGQEKLLDCETIKAAATGERWAMEKVLTHYAGYINELSTMEIRQTNGKEKKTIDEDIRQHIFLKPLEALPSPPLEQRQTVRELHSLTPLCGYHLRTPETDTPAAWLYLFQGSNYSCNLCIQGIENHPP